MKACPRCKTQNDDNARFCIGCSEYLMPAARKCPNGHTMDFTWTECAYCKNQVGATSSGGQPQRVPTVIDNSQADSSWSSANPSPAAPSSDTASSWSPPAPPPPAPPSSATPPPRRRVTEYKPGGVAPASAAEAPRADRGAGRKIVGILITYTWKPEGQVFPVREGRNLIGRDEEQCEIAVPQDTTLSATNSHITYRKSFVVGDMVSMSGTDLNGEPIEQQFRPLPNYSTVRTGSTYWTFIQIERGPDDAPATR